MTHNDSKQSKRDEIQEKATEFAMVDARDVRWLLSELDRKDAALRDCLCAIPTTWLDDLLTGPTKVGSYTSSIEPLINAIRARVEKIVTKALEDSDG